MKIYKLDIDTSKPTRQVVAMQQNSTGVLSVDVANDGKYIRNLSCSLYEGDNEISATTDNGYKIDVGGETKAVKFVAKSVPYDSVSQYVLSVSGAPRARNVYLHTLQIKPGVYNQDEFAPVLTQVKTSSAGMTTWWYIHASNLSSTNFKSIAFTPWNQAKPYWFFDQDNIAMPEDVQISASSEISVGFNRTITKQSYTLSSYTYPSVGYYTDCQMDTIIKPTTNAACYAEYDIAEPTPEEPDEEPPAEEPAAETDGE